MKTMVKMFPTSLFKEIVIVKNLETKMFDLRVAFYKSNAVTLFEGSAKTYQINHLSNIQSVLLYFYAEVDPEITKIVIRGKFQIRTFVQNDIIRKYVIEKCGARYDPLKVIKIEI